MKLIIVAITLSVLLAFGATETESYNVGHEVYRRSAMPGDGPKVQLKPILAGPKKTPKPLVRKKPAETSS
ncbi:unnamed protein product [Orchesella dallaii]|uniref:Uncharacterized protein n=1 Tax=Orchesella dallaii TaxID=48710 RepID=A0ABP1RAI1_9HEXA